MWANEINDPVSKFISNAKDLAEIAAILIGGAWTYLNYFRGRTYKPRLETNISGEAIDVASHALLKVNAQIKNVGLSKVNIDQQGTAVLVQSPRPATSPPANPMHLAWAEPSVFEVFKDHRWIEPGETITETLVLQLPADGHVGYRVEFVIVSGRVTWTTECLAETKSQQAQIRR